MTSSPAPASARSGRRPLLIFATKDDDILDGGALRQLNDALDGASRRWLPRRAVRAVNETVVVHTFGKTETSRVVIAGLGPAEQMGLDEIRNAPPTAA